MKPRRGIDRLWFAAAALIVLALSSCEGRAVRRYALNGSVQFRGQPVPLGRVTFEPDVERGNSGPGTCAFIRDGKFRTQAGKGHSAGPHIIRILGFQRAESSDEGTGLALFTEHIVREDLPRNDCTREFIVRDE